MQELRAQDYQQGRKTAGGFGQSATFGTQPSTSTSTTTGLFGNLHNPLRIRCLAVALSVQLALIRRTPIQVAGLVHLGKTQLVKLIPLAPGRALESLARLVRTSSNSNNRVLALVHFGQQQQQQQPAAGTGTSIFGAFGQNNNQANQQVAVLVPLAIVSPIF